MIRRGLTLAFLVLLILAVSTPWAISQQEGGVPAYHVGPPAKDADLPPLLAREQLWGANAQYAFQGHAYELAAKIPNVIYQQPCYCYCDRGMGHKSLRSCFEGTHGAQCSVCLREVYYSYSQHQKGKTPAQTRQGIMKGEWKQVDLQTGASTN
jgi:hypothetical protein